jgi:hypothetical protein
MYVPNSQGFHSLPKYIVSYYSCTVVATVTLGCHTYSKITYKHIYNSVTYKHIHN